MYSNIERMQDTMQQLQQNLEIQMREYLIRDMVDTAVSEFKEKIQREVESRVQELTITLVKSYFNDMRNKPEVQVVVNQYQQLR